MQQTVVAPSPLPSRPTAQAIALVLGGMLLVISILLALDRFLVRPTFATLEGRQALEDNERAMAALDTELAALVDLDRDWSNWDDAYAFARTPYQAFIDSNAPDAASLSINSGIDLLAFFNSEGAPLLRMVYHPQHQRVVPLHLLNGTEPPIVHLLAPVLRQETPVQGLVDTEYGLLLLAANPILTSDERGPSRGVALMGRFLDATKIEAIAARTKVVVEIAPRRALPAADQAQFDRLAASPAPGGPKVVDGAVYRLLTDVTAKPLALLRTPIRGEITALGAGTSRLLITVLSLIALALLICLALYRWRMTTAHQALEASEARYRQLFEAESDAIFLIDKESGRILEANQAATTLYGFSREELLRLNNTDLSTEPEETRRITRETALDDHQVVTVPFRYHRKKDGTVFPVEITGRFFIHKGRQVHIAAVRDISERKRAEKQLRLSQFALDHYGDATYWANKDGVVLAVNKEACRSLGYSEEEFAGKTVADIDVTFPFATWSQHWRDLQARKSILLESVHKTKDGRTIPVEIRANHIAFDGEEYNFAVVRDISERKRLERERAELEAMSRRLLREESLGRLAGAVAHHFNNQLTAIMGYIELASDQLHDGKEAGQELAQAMDSARRATQISTLMLTYLGQIYTTARRPTDLAEVCQRALPMLRTLLLPEVELQTDLPSPGPVVELNEEQIGQILANLVANGVESLDHRPGRLSLAITTRTAGELAGMPFFPVDWRPRGQAYACLSVADTGCGIAPENLEKLFDPFYSSKFTGRGLGLSVVLGLAKVHDGAVSVESRPGAGSVFHLILPLAPAPRMEQSAPIPP